MVIGIHNFLSDVHNKRDTTKLYGNKISRLVSRKAFCYIVKQPLVYGEIAIHRILFMYFGETDEYESIIIVQEEFMK